LAPRPVAFVLAQKTPGVRGELFSLGGLQNHPGAATISGAIGGGGGGGGGGKKKKKKGGGGGGGPVFGGGATSFREFHWFPGPIELPVVRGGRGWGPLLQGGGVGGAWDILPGGPVLDEKARAAKGACFFFSLSGAHPGASCRKKKKKKNQKKN